VGRHAGGERGTRINPIGGAKKVSFGEIPMFPHFAAWPPRFCGGAAFGSPPRFVMADQGRAGAQARRLVLDDNPDSADPRAKAITLVRYDAFGRFQIETARPAKRSSQASAPAFPNGQHHT